MFDSHCVIPLLNHILPVQSKGHVKDFLFLTPFPARRPGAPAELGETPPGRSVHAWGRPAAVTWQLQPSVGQPPQSAAESALYGLPSQKGASDTLLYLDLSADLSDAKWQKSTLVFLGFMKYTCCTRIWLIRIRNSAYKMSKH